ncbi:MAG: M20/M25/M40 family metallo-hydrolase [Archaeoglobaceae archaeon]|nr:M20/M25/M40 family metallo-hydrolase [Archaeoglobaceae archaeon]MCX8152245.1 M20/M25/M40 family metallo-hydrolase [Archaeoglobaceae archaeon]MDW8013923.1 M20/M25/M40 family metallo-hydrolase [Archaeoglobaceae archaeon]
MNAVDLLTQLIKIDTRNPPGSTCVAAEKIAEVFSSYKVRFYEKEDKKVSIVVEIEKGEPTLMLTSHLDTVPSEDIYLNPVIVNGKIYGRGACDAKASVAAMMCASLKAKTNCGLKLAFTCDEEIGGKNGLGFVFEKEKADAVIIGEPTGLDSVGVLQANVLALELQFYGESGHTALKDPREGAIYKASKFLIDSVEKFKELKGDFEEYSKKLSEIGFDFYLKSWQTAFNPAIISGGVKRNVVASNCSIKADVRFSPWVSMEEVLKILKCDNYIIEGFLPAYGFLYDGVDFKRDVLLLNLIKKVIESFGLKPKAFFSLGVGDTRHVRKKGVPAFYYGPSGGNIHGDDEFVYLNELLNFVEAYKRTIEFFKMY